MSGSIGVTTIWLEQNDFKRVLLNGDYEDYVEKKRIFCVTDDDVRKLTDKGGTERGRHL